jgi:16S rRNA (cytosine967-C5)-methyltransferase
LIYSTCSLETEENEEVCEAFLSRNGDLFKKAEPAMPTTFRTPDGYYRTFPHRDDMDGFFVASFVKR